MEIFDAITDEPSSISDIASRTNKHALLFEDILRTLIQKRYVRQVGFTPTDVLHVTGDYTRWNSSASMLGASILSEYTSMEPLDFCTKLKEDVAREIVLNLIAHCADKVKKTDLDKILTGAELMKFTIKTPVVIMGAPVAPYLNDIKKFIDADIRLPQYHEVGNAVGTLVGNVVYREEVLIRPASPGSSQYLVFSENGRQMFDDYQDALDMANSLVNSTVSEYMSGYGLSMDNVRFDIECNNIGSIGTVPLETKIVGVAVGSPRGLI